LTAVRDENKSVKFSRRLLPAAAAILCGVLLATGCSSTTEHKWLTFFFDGVPSETSVTNQAVAPVATSTNRAAAVAPKPQFPKPPENFMHRPYAENKCAQCHGGDMMTAEPRVPVPQLCYTCHKDFPGNYKVKHQPVENGECLSCHDPHQSPNKNLLLKKGSALCLTCHDDPLAAGKVKHQAVEAGDCTDCHSPHATNFKGLLKKSVKDTCLDCHDDLIGKKKIVHQPVDDGDCMECHAPHATNFKGLMKKSVKNTCADCHDDIPAKQAKVVHQPVDDGDCLACHDPHASDRKALVKKTTPALCWDCHDNFLEKAKFTHDVVEDCTGCHNPHSTSEKALMKKGIPALCFDCHDQKDVAAVKGHADIGTKSCVQCHDPHVGQDKNLLKPAAKSPGAANGSPP